MAAAAIDIEAAKRAALEEACLIVKGRAKDLIGVPQPSWPPLAPETLKRKDGINTPLLESGLLRSSLAHTVIDSNHAEVGSDLDRAVWMELGTSRGTPPGPTSRWPRISQALPLRRWSQRQSVARSAADSQARAFTTFSRWRAWPERRFTSLRSLVRTLSRSPTTRRKNDDT
jgi:hypothetical protein